MLDESDYCQFSLESHRVFFGDLLAEDVRDKQDAGTTFDLIANVVHDVSQEKKRQGKWCKTLLIKYNYLFLKCPANLF